MDSSHNYSIKNAHIMARRFWDSFSKLMGMQGYDLDEKVRLVKFKKDVTVAIEDIAETMRDLEPEMASELLSKEFSTEFKPVNVPLDSLSPEDLFQLEGIINTEV